jgi:tyrosinase
LIYPPRLWLTQPDGRPYRSWDGVNGAYQTGYCTHASIIFPTWHRPYLSLYEQLLWNNTQTIAKRYPTTNRATYQAAADSFRIPYWDWASGSSIPSSLTSSRITINTPTGSQRITNPLYRYVFRPTIGAPDFPSGEGFQNAPYTTRDSRAASNINANAASIHDRTYLLLSRQTEYAPFSNRAYVDSRGNQYDSAESIHDNIHGMIGGWMGLVGYSSFDPIFFLHHTNVDRLFAIWQAINPNSYLTTSQANQFGTFTIAPGALDDVNTALTPFHSDAGTGLYTSVTARSTRSFGYTVPEVRDWGLTPAQVSANTRAAVKQLYDPNNQFTPRGASSASWQKRQSPSNPDISIPIPPALKNGTNRAYREWYANIRINKFVIGQSFFLHLFIGDVPSDPAAWLDPATTSFVGTDVIFMDSAMAGNGRKLNIFSQLPLTRKLVELYNAGVIPDLEVKTIRPYLKKNLKWRAQRYDLSEVSVKELKGLRVFVLNSLVTPPRDKDRDFPTYGPLVPVPEVTDGVEGGVPAADAAALETGAPPA